MNILKAAAKAAGQVGTLYATAVIDDRVEAKREARLMQREERGHERSVELAEMQHGWREDLSKTEHERALDRMRMQQEARAGEISGTLDLGSGGKYFYTPSGDLQRIEGSGEAYRADASAESKRKELDQINKLELELYKNQDDMDPSTFNEERQRLKMRRQLMSADTPEEKQSVLDQARQAAIESEMRPIVQTAITEGKDLNALAEAYETAGDTEAADYIRQHTGGAGEAASQAGGPGQQGALPAPGTPEFKQLPVDQRREVALQSKREKASAKEAEQQAKSTARELQEFAKSARQGMATPSVRETIINHYEFIKKNLGMFDSSDLEGFNAVFKLKNEQEYEGAEVYKPFPTGK